MYVSRKCLCFSVIGAGVFLAVIAIGYVFYTNKSSVDPIGPRSVPSLKLVAVLTRHGNRAPGNIIYNDTSQWSYGLEELTNVGRLQMFNLGVRLRSMYNGFLKEEYSAGDLYATSTLKNRTLQSALCLLAGLYPPRGFQIWNEDILWQPIPVFTDSPDKVEMIFKLCPRYAQDYKTSVIDFAVQYATDISSIVTKIAPYMSNGKHQPSADLRDACDMMLSEDIGGVPLPTWSKEVYPHPILDLYYQMIISQYMQSETMIRLLVGPFWDNLLKIFSQKINGTLSPDRQFYYFSGHDVPIMALQLVLDIPTEDRGVVYPASALVFELLQHQTTGALSVQIYLIQLAARHCARVVCLTMLTILLEDMAYGHTGIILYLADKIFVLYIDGKYQGEPKVLRVGGCDTSCEFNQLVNLTKRFSDVDFDTECQVD